MDLLNPIEINLGLRDVLRGMGADPARIETRRPSVVEAALWAIQEGMPLIEPRVAYKRYRVESFRHERLKLAGGEALSGALIAQHLAASQEVIVIGCTVGGSLEQIAAEVIKEEPLKGLALDGFGSAAVETLANIACAQFEEEARQAGLHTSIPLSPGMIGWPVDTGQPQIFSLLSLQEIGVNITEYGMMVPVKSLSMVLGVGEEMVSRGRTCDYCNLKAVCQYQDHFS